MTLTKYILLVVITFIPCLPLAVFSLFFLHDRKRFQLIWIVIDILIAVIIYGKFRTLSSIAGEGQFKQVKHYNLIAGKIDFIAGKDHCKQAYVDWINKKGL